MKQATKRCEGKTPTSAKHHHKAGSQGNKGRSRQGKKTDQLGNGSVCNSEKRFKRGNPVPILPFFQREGTQRTWHHLRPIFPSARTKDGALLALSRQHAGLGTATRPLYGAASLWYGLSMVRPLYGTASDPAPLALGRGLPGGGASGSGNFELKPVKYIFNLHL